MVKISALLLLSTFFFFSNCPAQAKKQVTVSDGTLEGSLSEDGMILYFKGVPYAQPPVGELRFREPQPVKPWTGIRPANHFGPRAMQLPIYGDMQFRSDGVSEDCLYLNIWMPAASSNTPLPVLVYFYGGGFIAGDGSEYRYDGESLARKGFITITVNYRLGIFGFLSHPDLTRESPHHSSGNYGLLDQHAALEWVQKNIAFFNGDPHHVTIAGESAGSYSVSAQMASPLSKGLFQAAIGESGSLLGDKTASLAEGEKQGLQFAAGLGNKSLADLRAMSATELLQATEHADRFPPVIDGYFLPQSPDAIFAAGEQMQVPLMAGWNSAEGNYTNLLGQDSPTVDNYQKALRKRYPDHADELLNVYKATTVAEVKQAATDLMSDEFIAFSTWKWINMHSKTGNAPVYQYFYAHPRPTEKGATANPGPSMGAGHSWEIEYALGNLPTNNVYAWTKDDFAVSTILEGYFANFIRTFDPNGTASGKRLPLWKPAKGETPDLMIIDIHTRAGKQLHPERYQFLDKHQ